MGIWADIKKRIVQFFRKEPLLEYEVTEYVFSDRQPLDGSSTISFFVNNPKPDVSVTRTFDSENQAVNWLMGNRDFKRMLFGNLFTSYKLVKRHSLLKNLLLFFQKIIEHIFQQLSVPMFWKRFNLSSPCFSVKMNGKKNDDT